MQEDVIEYKGEKFFKTTYNGISVIRDSNGYYQASKICRDNDKDFYEWKRNERTNRLIQIYSNTLRITDKSGTENSRFRNTELFYKKTGEFHEFQGYYIHRKLVNDLCMWCNLEYAVKVNEIMDLIDEELNIRNLNLETKIKEMEENLNKLKIENDELRMEIKNKSVKTKIDTRTLRIYTISSYDDGEEPHDPMDDNCIWWISADNNREYD